MLLELTEDRSGTPREHAAVPVILAAGYVFHRLGDRGLFGEFLHLEDAFGDSLAPHDSCAYTRLNGLVEDTAQGNDPGRELPFCRLALCFHSRPTLVSLGRSDLAFGWFAA